MKINHLSDKPVSAAPAVPGKLAGRSAPTVAPASPPTEASAIGASLQVQLSSTTQSMVASGSNLGAVFNTDKVQAMRDAIENGSFQVNAGAIADKMLGNARDLWRSSSAS